MYSNLVKEQPLNEVIYSGNFEDAKDKLQSSASADLLMK